MGNSELECENWVRLMFVKSNGQLLICTSNAMKPQLRTLEGQNLMDLETPNTVIGICSPHDNLNTTAVYVGRELSGSSFRSLLISLTFNFRVRKSG